MATNKRGEPLVKVARILGQPEGHGVGPVQVFEGQHDRAQGCKPSDNGLHAGERAPLQPLGAQPFNGTVPVGVPQAHHVGQKGEVVHSPGRNGFDSAGQCRPHNLVPLFAGNTYPCGQELLVKTVRG